MEHSKKTILVTGGAGYVGSHCVVKLLENGNQVVVVDNLVNAWKDDKKSEPEAVIRCQIIAGRRIAKFYPIDISNRDELCQVFKKHKIDCVMHFAALKSVSESCEVPIAYYHNNILGAITLIEVMECFGVKEFIYSSSSTVYGTPEYLPFDEKHPTGRGCTNPYGKSKYFVEEMLKDLAVAEPDWKIISLRYFNPVGAHPTGKIGEHPKGIPNNLMPYVAQVAVGKRPILHVYGNDYDTPDGTGVRDYIHIEDLAEGHIAALKKVSCRNIRGFKAYNLGTGRGYSVLEVIKEFENACGHQISYDIVGRREGDIATSYCDATLAKSELQWFATRDLADMCSDMWRWQENNPNGYESIGKCNC